MKIIRLKPAADGEILLLEDKLQINDKSSRMNSVLFRFFPFLFLFVGAYFLAEAIFSSEILPLSLNLLTSGLFFFVPIVNHSLSFRRTNIEEIRFSEVEKASLRKIMGALCLDLQLKNNLTRRIYNLNELSDWEIIKEQLSSNNISCS